MSVMNTFKLKIQFSMTVSETVFKDIKRFFEYVHWDVKV